MYQFFTEQAADYWEIETLFDLCFAPSRKALSSYQLRNGVASLQNLSVVAFGANDVLSAAIRFWPVYIETTPALLLGPIAVHPACQGEGLGATLIRIGLEKAKDAQWSRVLLVGDLLYYERFGFFRLNDVTMPPPTNPERILGKALTIGAWEGIKGKVGRWMEPL
ncbi:MAG: N-acetyltransferase [Aestuariivita sp.]|nr:N-acetyltransferase [Aestuariivita sp.]